MNDDSLTLERIFDADCETLFDAWTNPDVMAQWFFVGADWAADAETDVREGGAYRLSMKLPTGDVHTMTGTYREVQRPRRLVFTWSSHVAENTVVTIELEPVGDRTRLRLTHDFLPHQEAREAHAAGWQGCLDSLGRVVGR